jgi:hypothetical protein
LKDPIATQGTAVGTLGFAARLMLILHIRPDETREAHAWRRVEDARRLGTARAALCAGAVQFRMRDASGGLDAGLRAMMPVFSQQAAVQ